MSRQNLTATKGGINRLRVKGSPSPDTLFDALNCYVDASGVPQSRPGTAQDYALPNAVPKGLAAYGDGLVTFSHVVEAAAPAGVSVLVLSNPDDPTQPIKEIHFAAPYMGFLYVAAEFDNGDVFHYWLQAALPWRPNTMYRLGDLVSPIDGNGLAYRATRLLPADQLWQANAPRAIGDVVEPTSPDGFKYTVINTIGSSPRSAATEPNWNDADGALTYEDVDISGGTDPGTDTDDGSSTVPADIEERYDNPSGNRPNDGAIP